MPKYKIGQNIKYKDKYDEYVFGHVVVIISTVTGLEYYCSMYPGALSDYYYVYCADLSSQMIYDGELNTCQALNKFYEDELEYADDKKVRKNKLIQIEKLNDQIKKS